MWDDAENLFDCSGSNDDNQPEAVDRSGTTAPNGSGPATTGLNAGALPATNFDAATTSELATTREGSAYKPTSRRVGEPLLDLELDFYFALPTGKWPEVISARQFDEVSKRESKREEERTGLLELSVQKSGHECGIVRQDKGYSQSANPPRNNELAGETGLNLPQFAVGQVVRLLRRLETFRGPMSPGDGYVVSSVGLDSHGATVVALSRGGAVLVSGLIPDATTLVALAAMSAACDQTSVNDLIG